MLKLGGEKRRLVFSWRALREIEAALQLKTIFDLWRDGGPLSSGEPPSVAMVLIMLRAGLLHEGMYSTDELTAWLDESRYDAFTVWREINEALSESVMLPENAEKDAGKKKRRFHGIPFANRRGFSG